MNGTSYEPAAGGHDDRRLSMEETAHLDAFLDQLIANRRPAAHDLIEQELADRLLAAQLRLLLADVETPSRAFLRSLEHRAGAATDPEHQQPHQLGVSRRHVLRTGARAVAAAGLVGAGLAADEAIRHLQQPMQLVAGPSHWYDIAAVDEVAAGQTKAFAAGGVLGYLLNDGQHLRAVSAICTHMGCRLKPTHDPTGLRCLCHGARFGADGAVLAGPAAEALPRLSVRAVGGRIYVRGTVEDA